MKRFFCTVLAVCLLCLSGCGKSESLTDQIGAEIGLDLTGAENATRIDTHGGFQGDGNTVVTMSIAGDALVPQIRSNPDWHPLPFTENLTAIVYGIRSETASIGPYITVDNSGTAAVPQITNGYYFFLDRHSQSTDPQDDTNVLSRASFNLTVAIYDCDTEILYYLEFDT